MTTPRWMWSLEVFVQRRFIGAFAMSASVFYFGLGQVSVRKDGAGRPALFMRFGSSLLPHAKRTAIGLLTLGEETMSCCSLIVAVGFFIAAGEASFSVVER